MEKNFSILENHSKYHNAVIDLLRKEFPLFHIIQEFPVSIDGKTLYCDILCKSPLKFIIEINSRIHYQFVPMFHNSYDRFLEFQHNDTLKEKWAEINDYLFIVLKEEDFKKNEYIQIIKDILK
ncbi:MAG: hypothetical protein PHP92_04195 [Candidatus Nanoarchaeia archaeon]|nr:hypothetical protein [Candidatus Nanoarchaeia archaeon]